MVNLIGCIIVGEKKNPRTTVHTTTQVLVSHFNSAMAFTKQIGIGNYGALTSGWRR